MNETISFSEAMRLGATMHEQAFGSVIETRPFGFPLRTCAWGAAIKAAGLVPMPPSCNGISTGRGSEIGATASVAIPDHWVEVITRSQYCQECGKHFQIAALISHLNDVHRLTRNEIADVVERVEREVYAERADQPTEKEMVSEGERGKYQPTR